MMETFTTKQSRRAAIVREQWRRYLRREPRSLREIFLSHLGWVGGHRRLYAQGSPLFDIAFCYETLGWARQCNERIRAACQHPLESPAAAVAAEVFTKQPKP